MLGDMAGRGEVRGLYPPQEESIPGLSSKDGEADLFLAARRTSAAVSPLDLHPMSAPFSPLEQSWH